MSELAFFCGHDVVIKQWGKRSGELPPDTALRAPQHGLARTVRQAGETCQVVPFERGGRCVAGLPASRINAVHHATSLAYKIENVKGKTRR